MNNTTTPQLSAERRLKDRIREIVGENASVKLPLEQLTDSTDLYRAGMTSYSSVLLMIAIENEFGLEFPDGMLSRDVFESIDAISTAIETLQKVKQ